MKSGIINVYKEAGYTSFDVVAKLRGILHTRKIGHTGTLDPDAVGVLPVCIGKATKVCDMLTNTDKTYVTTLLMGVSTDTYDTSGTILEKREVNVTPDIVEETIKSFIGKQEQIPPMYSAIKVNGKKLYELAREGKVIDRKARTINIYNIEIIDIELPRVKMRINCSKGTYIRSLCHDIGMKLGTLGCMENLLRERVGDFSIDNSIIIEEIQSLMDNNMIDNVLIPVDNVFISYPKAVVKKSAAKSCLNGAKLRFSDLVDGSYNINSKEKSYRLYLEDGEFVGIYRKKQNNLVIEKMFYENI